MKVILCGYQWAGCDALRKLLDANHEVFVYTHDTPWHIPSLPEYCDKVGVDYSKENISTSKLPFKPDVISSIYYRNIIKPEIIQACDGHIFNLHPSLLPAYRGCSSLTWAMINGENECGYTYHLIDEGCDTGNILIQKKIDIRPYDTQQCLFMRVMFLALQDFLTALDMCAIGKQGVPQHGQSSTFRRGCPYDGVIDKSWGEEKTDRFIRSMINPPLPTAKLDGVEIKTMEDYQIIKRPDQG